jgi:hypothetical protein
MQEFLTQIEPALVTLAVAFVTAVLGIIGKLIYRITPKIDAWFTAKLGNEVYQGAKAMAYGVWLVLEKNFPQLTGTQKRLEMEKKLLARFPSLTQDELDAINKEINGMLKWSQYDSGPTACAPEPESEEVEYIASPGPTEV